MQVASRQCVWKLTPEPSYTAFYARVSETTTMEIRLGQAVKASGSSRIVVHWGDGEKTVASAGWTAGAMRHIYGAPGTYLVRISDDVRTWGMSVSGGISVYNTALGGHALVSLGSRVTAIATYGFLYMTLPGKLELPTVVSAGNRAFENLTGCTDLVIPSMARLSTAAFKWFRGCPLIHCDNVKSIDPDFFGDGTYDWCGATDLYLGSLTCDEVKAMEGFPFGAMHTVRFHCSDGVLYSDGSVV